ncbi:MAG TPA: ABC transporter substrate-binding protein [bacterium]|mgnify:CR=1 FL=1|nr:ABC transporter substrate-binding protein [bacterium]
MNKGFYRVLLCLVICMLLVSNVPVSFAQKFPDIPQYTTPAEYEKATGKKITKLNEASQLAELVKQGKLPSVEQRLPKEPLVVVPVEEVGKYGGVWRTAMLGSADTMHLAREVGYEPLVRIDGSFSKVIPGVAKSWTVSKDGKTFTFYLREGMKWSDGEAFTADDIMFWYNDILLNKELTPVISKQLTSDGKPVKVEKINDYTVRFTFTQPQGLFLPWLSTGLKPFAPKHYLKDFHPAYAPVDKLNDMAKKAGFDYWYQLFAVKNDPWMNPDLPVIHAWKVVTPLGVGTRVSFERNPFYWKMDIAGNQLPYIDRFTADIVDSLEVMIMKTVSGEIDCQHRHIGQSMQDYPFLMEQRSKGNYRILTQQHASAVVASVFLNLNHKDPIVKKIFNDIRFRQALSLAINRKEIIDLVYLGKPEPWQISPKKGTPLYYEKGSKAYTEYDPNRANQLLDRMGLKKGSDGWRLRPDGKQLTITIEIGRTALGWPDAAEMVKKYWENVGVKTVVKVEDRSIFTARYQGAEHDAVIWAGEGSAGLEPLLNPWWYVPVSRGAYYAPLWGLWYETKGQSGEEPVPIVKRQMQLYDKLLNTTNSEKQLELMREIIKLAADNLWHINICTYPDEHWIVKNNFRNVPDNSITSGMFPNSGPYNPCQFFIK